jgi:TrmH family RNA methyltransferase
MLSQNQIRHIASLKMKKFREEHGQFIAEGSKLVADVIAGGMQIVGLYASAEWLLANLALIRQTGSPVYETLPREMERISALTTPSPVLAVVRIPDADSLPGFWGNNQEDNLILALDDIRDPGNFGTILRIADWFGIHTVLCSETCVDTYNPKVVQATMGSVARLQVIRGDLAVMLGTLSGSSTPSGSLPVYGTFLDGEPIFSQKLSNHGVIVIGNESRGISPELMPLITHRLYIPPFGSLAGGKAESLNASIAAAIICAEFRRPGFVNKFQS